MPIQANSQEELLPPPRLRMGLFLPCIEHAMSSATARWTDLLAMAKRADGVGFDSVSVLDHLLFRFDHEETIGAWELPAAL